MENVATETLKITSSNPQLLSGILIIMGVFTLLYVVLWVKFNNQRKQELVILNRHLDRIHSNILEERFRKKSGARRR